MIMIYIWKYDSNIYMKRIYKNKYSIFFKILEIFINISIYIGKYKRNIYIYKYRKKIDFKIMKYILLKFI